VFFQPSSADQSNAPVRSIRGVVSIVSFGHVPALVNAETLLSIQELEHARNSAELTEVSPMQPGKLVRFKSCALKGLQ
jgi:transcription antitermination factor NusG